MIVPPIVLKDSDGCLAFYDSIEEAVVNLDQDDVTDREFVAYDSSGRLLMIEPHTEPGLVATIQPAEDGPYHQDELCEVLRHALELKGVDVEISETLELPRLLEESLKRKRGYFLP